MEVFPPGVTGAAALALSVGALHLRGTKGRGESVIICCGDWALWSRDNTFHEATYALIAVLDDDDDDDDVAADDGCGETTATQPLLLLLLLLLMLMAVRAAHVCLAKL